MVIGMLEAGLRHVDVAEHWGVSRGTITRLAARYRVRGTVDFPAQADHELRRQFKTVTFWRHIYVIAFYRQRQLLWLFHVARTTE